MEQKLQSNHTLRHFSLINAMSLPFEFVEITLFLLLITQYHQLVDISLGQSQAKRRMPRGP